MTKKTINLQEKENRKMNLPFISVIIPTMNRKDDLLECIASIQEIDYPENKIELIIWDNGSIDGTPEAVKSKIDETAYRGFSRIVIIKSPENLGPYIPYNKAGSKLSRESKYILGLDDDVVLDKECLKRLIETTKLNPDVGVVGGCINYYDFPEKTFPGVGRINWWLGKFVDMNTDKLTKCDYVIGCCWLINKDVFNAVGGFDKDYFTMHWEIDFCCRVQKKGFNIYYQPEAIVKHKIPLKGKRDGLYYLYRNKLLLIRKNGTFLQKLTSLTIYTLFWLPKIILQSLMVNKGINGKEIRIILKAAFDGIIGKTGRQEI
jgi:GT2 family glycosyltransferase